MIDKAILLDIILKLILSTLIISGISLYISNGSFLIYTLMCAVFFISFIAIAIYRAEDKVTATSNDNGKRPFMLFAHSTVWAFVLGIVILILQYKNIIPNF